MSAEQAVFLQFILNPLTYEMEAELVGEPERFSSLQGFCGNWLELISVSHRDAYMAHVSQLVSNGGSVNFEYEILLETETYRVQEEAVLIKRSQDWPLLSGRIYLQSAQTAFDTSDFERLRSQALVGNLAAGLVHDFKNLLAGVQNIIEWSAMEIAMQPMVSKALGRTLDYIDQANNMVSSLLKVTSARPGDYQCFKLSSTVEDLEILLRHLLPSHITVQIEQDDKQAFVCGDFAEIQELLLNLCINARNAMRISGSFLKISTKAESREGKAWTCLRVEDDGCGIAEDDLKNIFEFFFTKSGGCGLGLWMVKRKLEQMGGTITVQSTPLKGTSFELYFPVADAQDLPKHQSPEQEKDVFELGKVNFKQAYTVLYVEDEPLIRSSVVNWLQSFGLNVISAEDGTQAFKLFLQHQGQLDLIIQDYVLPGMRGSELLRRMRQAEGELPIVVMSAYAGRGGPLEVMQLGATDFLAKPFKTKDLVLLLQKYLKENSELPQKN